METRRHHPVVVGIDGSAAGKQAARFAAQEACRHGTALRVVHVAPSGIPVDPGLPPMPGTLQDFGRRLVDQAVAAALEQEPEVLTEPVLESGSRVSTLVAAADGASLLVLGSQHRSPLDQLLMGGTATGVAARAHCPVVVVPETWDPARLHGRVVIGYKSTEHAAELLGLGFAVAAARDAELVVLHAWKLPGVYDDLLSTQVAQHDWQDHVRREVEPLIADLREAHPRLRVRVEAVHDQSVLALVDASSSADRLIILRPPRGKVIHHLGITARAVLRHAHCPVEVVPCLGEESAAGRRTLQDAVG